MALPVGLRCFCRSVQCGQNIKTVFLQHTTSVGRHLHSSTKKESITVELIGKICLIGINCPEKKNAVDSLTARHLYQAFQSFERNDGINVAVLYGKGGNFCAGFDLKEIAEEFRNTEFAMPDSPSRTERAPMGPTRMSFTKSVIAAVSGYAVAGGLELALMCDFRVIEESAVMGVFNRRLGVPLVDGCTVRLPKLIGLSRAMDLILTGRPVESKEALEIGLANRVVPNGTAIGQATQLALSISRYPQMCLNADRKSTYYSCYDASSQQDALQFEYLNGRDVLTVESIKGAKKFVEGYGKHGAFNEENKDK